MRKLFTAVSLVTALILASAVPIMAQGESAIHGTVKARADGSALPGAAVELQGDTLSLLTTTTTAEEQFVFARLVPGDYMLTVRLANFQDERYRLSLKQREVQTFQVMLALHTVHESVQVQADNIPSVFSPGSTHLTSERLAELPLTRLTNLADA
jgi:predicted phage tail protein